MTCYYSNLCEDKYKCCNFCELKNCQYRCKDEHKNCIYFIDERKKIIEAFKDTIKESNYKPKYLCEELSIGRQTLFRALKSDNMNINEETLNKIKEFNEKHIKKELLN